MTDIEVHQRALQNRFHRLWESVLCDAPSPRVWVSMAFVAVLGVMPARSNAQSPGAPTVLRQTVGCAKCRLELQRVATISDAEISLSTIGVFVAAERQGTYVVGNSAGEVARYSEAGRFREYLGRHGRGPREFLRPFFAALGAGDSLLVADREARRITVFGADVLPARTLPMGNLFELLVLNGSRFVYSGAGHDVRSGTHALHLHAADGQHIRSASAPSPLKQRPNLVTMVRYLAPAPGGQFLAATARKYVIERWDADLNLREVVVRNVDWFPPVTDEAPFDLPNRRPMPSTLMGLLGSERSGIVYSVIRKGTQGFSPDPKLKGSSGELGASQYPKGAALNRFVDTVLEAIDMPGKSVLANQTFKGGYNPVLGSFQAKGSPMLWRFAEAADGSEQVEVFTVRLIR